MTKVWAVEFPSSLGAMLEKLAPLTKAVPQELGIGCFRPLPNFVDHICGFLAAFLGGIIGATGILFPNESSGLKSTERWRRDDAVRHIVETIERLYNRRDCKVEFAGRGCVPFVILHGKGPLLCRREVIPLDGRRLSQYSVVVIGIVLRHHQALPSTGTATIQ